MEDFIAERLRPVAPGILLSLLTLVFGFGLGATFGAAEDSLKDGLSSRAEAVLESAYAGDRDQMTSVVKKSWIYYKRAHLHANGLGTASLACILLLALLGRPEPVARAAAISFGVGAFVYPIYWLLAGYLAPGLGGTGAAKEALGVVAIPSSGLCIIGLLLTLYCFVNRVFLGRG